MNASELAAMHGDFAQAEDLPALTATGLGIDPDQDCDSHEELLALIAKFDPQQGWYTQQSKNILVRNGSFSPSINSDGFVLAGEFLDANGRALHVRYRSDRASWHAVTFKPQASGDYLSDSLEFIAAGHDDLLLTYRRYWQITSSGSFKPFAMSFNGFLPAQR